MTTPHFPRFHRGIEVLGYIYDVQRAPVRRWAGRHNGKWAFTFRPAKVILRGFGHRDGVLGGSVFADSLTEAKRRFAISLGIRLAKEMKK